MVEDLQDLNQHTESDFLGIGGKLMEFLQHAEKISSGFGDVTVLISGEHGRHAAEVLECALERCRQMETRAAERTGDLGSLRDGARLVHNTFSGFGEFVLTFRTLCTLTRIETARLGGAGADFGSLAEDVESLAESMASKVEGVLAATIQLDARVEHAVANLSDVDGLLKDLSQVITGIVSNLDAFSQQQAAAVTLSARLASDCNSATTSIKDAVTSIQFHDITRQQVEHVVEALSQVRSAAQGHGSRLSREAATTLVLEASQLADAEEKFTGSVGRLLDDLNNIAACVREMAGNGESLLDASGNDENSFFRKMEQCLTVILSATHSFEMGKSATQAAANELGATLEAMRNAAMEIRAIDIQLLRVALNACLHAAHIGAKGQTLGVLAGALQDLAMRFRERSGAVGGALDSMSAAVTRLSRTDATHVNHDGVEGEMRSTIEGLHSWMEISFVRITETTSLATQLCEDLSIAQSNFSAGRLFNEVVTRCRGRLLQLASETKHESAGAGSPGLEDLARRYTMQAERDVHAAAIGVAAAGRTPGLSEPIGELGDNVELF